MINITVLNCSPEYPEELMTILAERDYSASLCSLDGKVPARHIGGQKPYVIMFSFVTTCFGEPFSALGGIIVKLHCSGVFFILQGEVEFLVRGSRAGRAA